MKTPTETELAYIAGLFDGEGCIIITLRRRGPVPRHYLALSISNTDRPILEWVQSCIGGGIASAVVKVKEGEIRPEFTSRTMWRLQAMTNSAALMLRQIRPYLRIKGEQADLALEFHDSMYCVPRSRGLRVPAEVIEWREQCRMRLSAMKGTNSRAKPL